MNITLLKNKLNDTNKICPYINLLKKKNTPCIVKNKKSNLFCGNKKILDIILYDEKFKAKYTMNTIIQSTNNKISMVARDKNDKKYFMKIKKYNTNYQDEVSIYTKLKGKPFKNILPIIDFVETTEYCYFIYEYCNGMNLRQYIENRNLSCEEIRDIFEQIVNGLYELHSNDIIHCDLKLENIMISNKNVIKIVDYDLSKHTDSEYVSNMLFGTMNYIAPESYNLFIYSKKSDIWSLGIILYCLLTKEYPYENDINMDDSSESMYRRNEFKHLDIDKMRLRIVKLNYPLSLIKLVEKLLAFKDSDRINLNEILMFDWK